MRTTPTAMYTPRIKKQRRTAELVDAVTRDSVLSLGAAADLLGVSEMTVRRDVADSGGALQILGGYVLTTSSGTGSYSLGQEQDVHLAAKASLAERALAFIEPGDTLFIDSGSTMPHLARRLPSHCDLTVVCYALNVAEALARHAGVSVILLGGLYHHSTSSFAADPATQLRDVRIGKAFISAGGIHAEAGVSCSHFHEVPTKQAAIELALESYLLADMTKFGKVKPAYFADCGAFAGAVTEELVLGQEQLLRVAGAMAA